MNKSPEPGLRVLHVIHGVGAGGAEALLYRLVTRPSAVRHEIISLVGPDWYSARLAAHGVPVHYLDIRSARSAAAAIPKLNSLIRRSEADVVQTWMYRSNVLAGVLARAAGKPVIWSIHSTSLRPLRVPSRLWGYLGGILASWLPHFVINCSARSAEYHARFGYGAAPGAVIPNGYDPVEFYPDKEVASVARRSLGVGSNTFLLGAIARWHPSKDIPTLLRGLKIASDRSIPIHCLLLGRGMEPDAPELAAAIREFGCEELVQPLGRREDIHDLARAIDLHVLSSFSEAFPNTVAETMLSGTPNVVTDVGDCALMVGDSGWVVPPRDPEKLATAIEDAHREWKDRPEQWQQRRIEARRLIADRFTFDRMAEAYEEVWKGVAKRSPGAHRRQFVTGVL